MCFAIADDAETLGKLSERDQAILIFVYNLSFTVLKIRKKLHCIWVSILQMRTKFLSRLLDDGIAILRGHGSHAKVSPRGSSCLAESL